MYEMIVSSSNLNQFTKKNLLPLKSLLNFQQDQLKYAAALPEEVTSSNLTQHLLNAWHGKHRPEHRQTMQLMSDVSIFKHCVWANGGHFEQLL